MLPVNPATTLRGAVILNIACSLVKEGFSASSFKNSSSVSFSSVSLTGKNVSFGFLMFASPGYASFVSFSPSRNSFFALLVSSSSSFSFVLVVVFVMTYLSPSFFTSPVLIPSNNSPAVLYPASLNAWSNLFRSSPLTATATSFMGLF